MSGSNVQRMFLCNKTSPKIFVVMHFFDYQNESIVIATKRCQRFDYVVSPLRFSFFFVLRLNC